MQDKESDGSKLVEIVARAICGHDIWEGWLDDALAALTAIKEAGMVIVPREPTKQIIDAWVSAADLDASGMTDDEWEVEQATVIYRAMITAGEE